MSVFRRNRHNSTASPYVSWTPTTEPVDPAQIAKCASATVSPQISTDAAAVPGELRDLPAPNER